MPLIKCPECGAMISDRAAACPHCGNPMHHTSSLATKETQTYDAQADRGTSLPYEKPERKSHGALVALIIVLACALAGGGYFAFTKLSKDVVGLTADSTSNVRSAPDGTYYMKGSVGNYSVFMQIIIDKGTAHGTYYYSTWNPDKVLFLDGGISDGKLVLTETTEAGNTSGKWEGDFDGNDYSGNFVNANNGKSFQFRLVTTDEPYKGRTARKAQSEAKTTDETSADNDNHDWLQGTWSARVVVFGQTKTAKLVVNGNRATFYSDGEALDNGEWQIYDGELHFGSTYFKIDESEKRVKFNDTRYFEHTSQPQGNAKSITTPSQDRKMRIMSRLHELGSKGQTLVSELSSMRQSGHIDPTRYMYIKQTLLEYKDEQIQLARQLGDSEMVSEYEQQKETVLRTFSMMEN